MKASPLYRDTLALCGVLLDELEQVPRQDVLRRRLAEGAIRLVDAVTLALKGQDREARVVDADLELATLRPHLDLALELGVLRKESYLAYHAQAEAVGKQLGGWLKKIRRRDGEPVGDEAKVK